MGTMITVRPGPALAAALVARSHREHRPITELLRQAIALLVADDLARLDDAGPDPHGPPTPAPEAR